MNTEIQSHIPFSERVPDSYWIQLYKLLEKIAYFRVGSDISADLAADAIEKVTRAIKSGREFMTEKHLQRCAVRAVINLGIDHLRRRGGRNNDLGLDDLYESFEPHYTLDGIEERVDAQKYLGWLNTGDRALLEERYLVGTPSKDIAEHTGTTDAAVKAKLHRLKENIEKMRG